MFLDKVERLKRKAKRQYRKYMDYYNGMGCDCGHELAQHISQDLANLAVAFNKTMDEITEIDPSCPKGRLIT